MVAYKIVVENNKIVEVEKYSCDEDKLKNSSGVLSNDYQIFKIFNSTYHFREGYIPEDDKTSLEYAMYKLLIKHLTSRENKLKRVLNESG